jgi:ABC-type bacteriocin/lantibiotic exporter with double-glycine peptidase domain
MLFFFSIKGLFVFLNRYLSVVFQQYYVYKVRFHNIHNLAELNYERFMQKDPGRIQNTIIGEMQRANSALSNYIMVLQYSVMVVVFTILAFFANHQFAFFVAIGGILTNLLFSRLYKKTESLSYQLTNVGHSFQGLLIQMVAFYKYLKATGNMKQYASNVASKANRVRIANKRIGFYDAIIQGLREPILIGMIILVLIMQLKVFGGVLSTILLSIVFFYRALNYVVQLQTTWNKFVSTQGTIQNLKQFNQELISNGEKEGEIPFQTFRNEIQLKEISLSMGSTNILNNVSLTIKKMKQLLL